MLSYMAKMLASAAGLLTTAEVARRLGVCRETVSLAARDGRLEPVAKLPGVNGAYLFTEESVIEWRAPGERLAGL